MMATVVMIACALSLLSTAGAFSRIARRHPFLVSRVNEPQTRKLATIVETSTESSVLAKPEAGAWMPFAVFSCLDHTEPTEIVVAGETYVVWKNPLVNADDDSKTGGWNIMKDACPHRLAPLSQGRIDPDTGCIECPYHGWQFAANSGECTFIPQLDPDLKTDIGSTKPAASSLPVHIAGNLLWGFVPLPANSPHASSYPSLPEEILPVVADTSVGFTSRELPYSFDFLVENFMDPAHIPFAHHSLQGVRSDGSPIPMEILTDIDNNATHVEVSFKDKIRGKQREGVVSFMPPCYYHFRIKKEEGDGENASSSSPEYKVGLIGLVVPTVPGKCRLIFGFQAFSPLFKIIPKWLIHSLSNRFVDTDLWVHEQERYARNPDNLFYSDNNDFTDKDANEDSIIDSSGTLSNSTTSRGTDADTSTSSSTSSSSSSSSRGGCVYRAPRYSLPTKSDTAIIAWRRWWAKHMSLSPLFGPCLNPPVIPRSEQYDLYASHTKHCIHCMTALRTAERMKRIAPLLGLFIIALGRNAYIRLCGVFAYYVLDNVANRVRRAVTGPVRGEKVSAAQFPEKKK